MSSRKTVGILGGGISGLSAAYYLIKRFGIENVRPVIFESQNRFGGWIKSLKRSQFNAVFETGPRTLRPIGLPGMNTLDLLEEIKLDKSVWFVEQIHPATKNRFIFKDDKLTRLPSDLKFIYKTHEPFSKPFIFSILRDLIVRKKTLDDDSAYEFFLRRFGRETADYLIDPLVKGVTGGDAKSITARLNFKEPFYFEQNHGSITKGFLASRFKKQEEEAELDPFDKTLGFSTIATESLRAGWAAFTVENGLESIPKRLEQILEDNKVEFFKKTQVERIELTNTGEGCSIHHKNEVYKCDHIISSIPAWNLCEILENSSNSNQLALAKILRTINGVDMTIVNLLFQTSTILKEVGFGFLVPTVEQNKNKLEGLLGVVFDTCAFPQEDNTILTLMCQLDPKWLEMSEIQRKEEIFKKAQYYLQKTLQIEQTPDDINIELSRQCIPQYTVGHYERIANARELIEKTNLPFSLSGASFDGISVNDCILAGKRTAYILEKNKLLSSDS